MKTLYIALLLIGTLSANELSWVDEQVEAIKPSRQGLSDKAASKLKDPFIFLIVKKEDVKGKKTLKKRVRRSNYVKKTYTRKFTLKAILNKSALINGRWYKEGDKVYGYKLKIIDLNTVLLNRSNKKILLSTKSKSKNLKFKHK
ncbi:hypothetical protein [Sulfurimonas sp.]|uniref:hypothetical protein n=1 Tax=Sulfurimonas sp. TaxID=2022749 RepID=UPI002606053A|nr:hypothetical protein [Sulfurimonas sp.]